MKKVVFTIKLAGFFTIIYLILFQCISPQYSTEYTAAIIDKYNLLHSIDKPKIILVGDSNIAFGFNSEKIENAFNMPVVNFGLHGALGMSFHSEMIKSGIHEGDIVIIAPAFYYAADAYSFEDNLTAWITIENNTSLYSGISYKNYKAMLLTYPAYLKGAFNLWKTNGGNKPKEGAYAREAFDSYGDNAYPRPACIMTEKNYSYLFSGGSLTEEMQIYWNDYNEFVLSKGATLFMSCPPILKDTLRIDLQVLQNDLENKLNFPMISKLDDYVYPLEYFYDSVYHLNDFGKEIRTEQLIADLQDFMP